MVKRYDPSKEYGFNGEEYVVMEAYVHGDYVKVEDYNSLYDEHIALLKKLDRLESLAKALYMEV